MRQPGKPAKTFPRIPRAGDTLGIIAPASQIKRQDLEVATAALQKLGYKITYSDSIFESDLFFAGDAPRRVNELHEMFARDDVTAIICARGGYGTNHLLPLIDPDIIRKHPKFFMGYSDVTSLLTYFCDAADMVTFHGPMAVSDREQFCRGDFIATIEKGFEYLSARTEQVAPGTARGILYGGCLSMLVASLGTPYEIETKSAVLYLEDINTKPYQIDRMLMQLKLAGKLDGVRGICFGEMMDCVQPGGQDYTLAEVLRRALGDLKIPVGIGMRSGHIAPGAEPNLCLPIGVAVEFTVTFEQATLKYRPSE